MNKPKDTEAKTLAGDGRSYPSEDAFKAFDLLSALVLGIDAGGRIVYANPAACGFFDRPGETLPGTPLESLVSPPLGGGWAKLWPELQMMGSTQGEAELRTRPHSPMAIRWRALHFQTGGNSYGFIFIHPREKKTPVELDLTRQRRQLSQMVDSIRQPVMILDEHHGIVYANDAVCKSMNRPVHQLIGKSVRDLMPGPQADFVWEKEQQALDSLEPVRFIPNADFQGPEGISVTMIPFIDQTHSRKHLFVVANRETDGAEAKKSPPDPDEILATPTPFPIQQLRASLNSARFLALVRDRNEKICWINSAFAREFGIDPGNPLDEQVTARIGSAANRREGDSQVTALNRPVFNIIERIADKGFFRKDKIPIHDECDEAVGVLEILVPMKGVMQDPAALKERYERIILKLDKLNTAIRVQTARRRQDEPKASKDLERLQQLVLPYVDRLKRRRLNREQRGLLDLIERTLGTQPPSPPASNFQLSPTETEVARHVKEGRTNLEIAALMGISKSTVLTHRHHVRDKLGLKNKKINLRTFLKEQTLAQAPE